MEGDDVRGALRTETRGLEGVSDPTVSLSRTCPDLQRSAERFRIGGSAFRSHFLAAR